MEGGILLLAAGYSQRYRQHTGQHKLLARPREFGAITLLEKSLQLASSASPQRLNVILRPQDGELIAIARRYSQNITLVNSDGLGSSIAAGVAAQPRWTSWLVMLADMPWLQVSTILQVGRALKFAATVRPCCHGVTGHPVGFNHTLHQSLLALRGDSGARELLRTSPPLTIPVDDIGCLLDVDVPDDLTKGNGYAGA